MIHTHGRTIAPEDAAALWELYVDECAAALVAKDWPAAMSAYVLMMQLELAAEAVVREQSWLPGSARFHPWRRAIRRLRDKHDAENRT
jgi:hypothetical protein